MKNCIAILALLGNYSKIQAIKITNDREMNEEFNDLAELE